MLLLPLLILALSSFQPAALSSAIVASARPSVGQSPADSQEAVEKIGGEVSAPILLSDAPVEFSEQARREKISGNVLVGLQIDKAGNPSHVHVLRGIGYGLDEKAIEAVSRYRFKPAMHNGHPVVVALNIEVHFQVYDPPR